CARIASKLCLIVMTVLPRPPYMYTGRLINFRTGISALSVSSTSQGHVRITWFGVGNPTHADIPHDAMDGEHSVANPIERLLRAGEGRILRRLQQVVKAVNALEDDYAQLTDDELRGETAELRARYEKGETLDQLMPEAFAAVREAAKRTLGQRHYDVQILGGAALHAGNIAEMKTGEGKTLVATLPAYLNAIAGKGVHVITTNDYLASYQAELMGRVYRALGMTTGIVVSGQTPAVRREQYNADITYGTNNEFGFDYLRDNMASRKEDLVQRDHFFALVDEVDSILIDEARTPLIISGPSAGEANRWFTEFAKIAKTLEPDVDYEVDVKKR